MQLSINALKRVVKILVTTTSEEEKKSSVRISSLNAGDDLSVRKRAPCMWPALDKVTYRCLCVE